MWEIKDILSTTATIIIIPIPTTITANSQISSQLATPLGH